VSSVSVICAYTLAFGSNNLHESNSIYHSYMSLKKADVNVLYPNASKKKVGEKLMGTLAVGDMVNVKLEQKVVKAEVLEVVSQMHAAYMSFEDYPSLYDEYQPTYLLRTPDRGEIAPNDLKPGLIVLDLSNSNVRNLTFVMFTSNAIAPCYSNFGFCIPIYHRSIAPKSCRFITVQWQECDFSLASTS